MTSLRIASALLGLLVMNLAAMGQPNAADKMSEEDVARSKEAGELLAPMFAANGVKDGYTWQVARVAPSYHEKSKFHESFNVGLRHALDRTKKGTGADWKVELQRREKIAQDKFGRSLWEIAVIKLKYKETRDELLLSSDDVVKLVGFLTLQRSAAAPATKCCG